MTDFIKELKDRVNKLKQPFTKEELKNQRDALVLMEDGLKEVMRLHAAGMATPADVAEMTAQRDQLKALVDLYKGL